MNQINGTSSPINFFIQWWEERTILLLLARLAGQVSAIFIKLKSIRKRDHFVTLLLLYSLSNKKTDRKEKSVIGLLPLRNL
jgi:hypothetical protein